MLTDPRLFNCIIMALYAFSAGWWTLHGKYWDAGYWICAFGITFVVTFGLRR